jgi:hypothetical protein
MLNKLGSRLLASSASLVVSCAAAERMCKELLAANKPQKNNK